MMKAKQDEMFVSTLLLIFKSKSERNLVAKVVTKPEFLVSKEKVLVTMLTLSVTISIPVEKRWKWSLQPQGQILFSYSLNYWQEAPFLVTQK